MPILYMMASGAKISCLPRFLQENFFSSKIVLVISLSLALPEQDTRVLGSPHKTEVLELAKTIKSHLYSKSRNNQIQ